MVLRRQLEKGDYNNITWASDSSRMASVLIQVNSQAFETARYILGKIKINIISRFSLYLTYIL